VNHNITRIGQISKKGEWHSQVDEGSPKTQSSQRTIPLSSSILRIIKPFMKIANGDHYVLSNDSKPVEPAVLRIHYKKVLEKAGVPNITFHGLRHTFATRCVESKCDVKTLSSILGHSSITTTMNLYVHPTIDHQRRCIDKMLKNLV